LFSLDDVNDDRWIAVRFGCYAAGAHLVLAAFVGIAYLASPSHDPMVWLFLTLFDLPMMPLFAPVMEHFTDRTDTGIWQLIAAGTLFWYAAGWMFGRVTKRVRYGSW
jgi:hypothetical protein